MCVMQARVVYARIVCPRAFVLRVGPVLVCVVSSFFFIIIIILFDVDCL